MANLDASYYWKIGILLFAYIALLLNLRRRMKTKSWITVEGEVIGPRTMGDSSQVDIRYLDQAGKEFVGQLSREFAHSYLTPAKERIPFSSGQKIKILYNPKNPKDLELIAGSKFGDRTRFLYVFIIALMMYFILNGSN